MVEQDGKPLADQPHARRKEFRMLFCELSEPAHGQQEHRGVLPGQDGHGRHLAADYAQLAEPEPGAADVIESLPVVAHMSDQIHLTLEYGEQADGRCVFRADGLTGHEMPHARVCDDGLLNALTEAAKPLALRQLPAKFLITCVLVHAGRGASTEPVIVGCTTNVRSGVRSSLSLIGQLQSLATVTVVPKQRKENPERN